MRSYEALFLIDPVIVSQDWNSVIKHIQSLISKHKGEITHLSKWGERRLAYDIKKLQRGVYVLVYFKCPPDKVRFIKRDTVLSNIITRCLIIRLSKEQLISKPDSENSVESVQQNTI